MALGTFYNFFNQIPTNRLCWLIFDQYMRQIGAAHANAIYDSLAWFYPDDPFVVKAANDWQTQHAAANAVPTDQLMKILTDELDYLEKKKAAGKLTTAVFRNSTAYQASPFTVAALVHSLVQKNDLDGARQLALRYQQLIPTTTFTELRNWTGMLVRKVHS